MLGDSVCHLMAHHHGNSGLPLADWQDACVEDHFAARHCEGVYLIVLNEVELPLVAFQLIQIVVLPHILLNRILNVVAHLFQQGHFLLIIRKRSLIYKGVVLLKTHGIELRLWHQ